MADDTLKKFKQTIGDFSNDSSLDEYYINLLNLAEADLLGEDIDEKVFNSDIGQATQILYAQALMDGKDISILPNISFLRNKLCLMTKGIRSAKESELNG